MWAVRSLRECAKPIFHLLNSAVSQLAYLSHMGSTVIHLRSVDTIWAGEPLNMTHLCALIGCFKCKNTCRFIELHGFGIGHTLSSIPSISYLQCTDFCVGIGHVVVCNCSLETFQHARWYAERRKRHFRTILLMLRLTLISASFCSTLAGGVTGETRRNAHRERWQGLLPSKL